MQKNIRFKIPKNALEKSAAKEVVRIAESGGKDRPWRAPAGRTRYAP